MENQGKADRVKGKIQNPVGGLKDTFEVSKCIDTSLLRAPHRGFSVIRWQTTNATAPKRDQLCTDSGL